MSKTPGEQLYSVWRNAPRRTPDTITISIWEWDELPTGLQEKWEHLAESVAIALDFYRTATPLLAAVALMKTGEGFKDIVKAATGGQEATHQGNTQWQNPDRTILVDTWWHEGRQYMTVAFRPQVGDSWGPPIQLVK